MIQVGIVTQARTGSSRLPNKVLLQVGGKSVLSHHLARLAKSGLSVFVATTTGRSDDAIVEIAAAEGVGCFRGAEADVLHRYASCAEEFQLDVVVRVTSDCPLVDGDVIAKAVQLFREAKDERLYLSNTIMRTFPRGFDFEIFSANALRLADLSAIDAEDREHVTPYLWKNKGGKTVVRQVHMSVDRSQYRVTLDTPADLQVIRELIETHHAAQLSYADITDLLDSHPELVALNAHIEQKPL